MQRKVFTCFDASCRDSDLVCEAPSLTEQQWKDDCDANNILELHTRGVVSPFVKAAPGQYVDTTKLNDFMKIQNQVVQMKNFWMDLPLKIRDRFGQDMNKFVEFATNPDNADELRQMGLLPPLPQAQEPAVKEPQGSDPEPQGSTQPPKAANPVS